MIEKFTVVDGHVHTFSTDEVASKIIKSFNKMYNIEFTNPGTGSINDVLQNMDTYGIDYTIMANFAPPKILHSNNSWAIGVSKVYKNLIALVSFHPEMEGDLLKLLEQYLSDGAGGIKLHPMAQGFEPNNEKLHAIYSYCNEIRLPVVFHCGRVSNTRLNEYSDIDMILPVIEKYSDLPIILTHMADSSAEEVINLAGRYTNIYFDTSIVITGFPPIARVNEPSWLDDSVVENVINSIGAERVLFGSDYPWGSPRHDVDRLLKMNLTHNQKSLILGENSIRIFKMDNENMVICNR